MSPLALTVNPLFPANRKEAISSPSRLPLTALLSKSTTLREFQQLHAAAIKSGPHASLSILSKLITACSANPNSSVMVYAQQLFDKIPHPDVVLFNTLARGYARSDIPLESFVIFVQMIESNILPDAYTFPTLLKACTCAKALEEGRQAHCLAIKFGFDENPYVFPTLINMYAECGEIRASRLLFNSADDKCIVSYNSIITACVRSSRPGEALALFRESQANGIVPTYVTMLSVLAACALLGTLDLGKWVHNYIRKNGFDSHIKVNTALIDMYAKCGSLEDAVAVFHEMRTRDTQAWSAMIVAYAIHGHGGAALTLFKEMKTEGVRPDEITFLGVLYACSHSGLVDEGMEHFNSMRSRYGVYPGIKHYGCVVDLLARAGRLEEAYSFIDGLPIKPTPVLWRTLLSSCGGHGNVDLGKLVFERIIEIDDSHGGDYVILSNLCASQGRWDDVNRVRKLMNERGAVKVPGCSSIEVENKVHEFFSGDGRHPESREAHKMVDEIVEQLKLVGYQPDTSRVFHPGMAEEEKESSLRYHSEKLAISFGLINTPPGTTIRVVKNLRVCPDCHSMAKMVSMVFDRQIILRDLNRFHHFQKGKCSCGDFW